MLDNTQVAVYGCGSTSYPETPPFHPSEPYPEYPFGADRLGATNPVYRDFRETLRLLKLDEENYGTSVWNPLGGLVKPGGTVIVKPNLVVSEHPEGLRGVHAAVAHGSVVRAIVDYIFIAMKGQGRIIVADSPIKEVEFPRIMELSGITGVKKFYDSSTEMGLELMDFRDSYVVRDSGGFMVEARPLPGDPLGYTNVDLGTRSMFAEVAQHWRRLRSTAVYYEDVVGEFHNPNHNIYSLPNTLLRADAVVSVAKLKTHRKGGVTLSLKNSVGATNEKRALPHHRVGSPSQGGDSVADSSRWDALARDRFRDVALSHPAGRVVLKLLGRPLKAINTRVVVPLFDRLDSDRHHSTVIEGDWYGNDTVWRMALDLTWALMFADRDGALREEPQRGYLSVIDGILGGEEEGPLFPTPIECGVLLAGFHPVTVDVVAAELMGFDHRKIPMLREAVARDWPLRPQIQAENIEMATNLNALTHLLRGAKSPYSFKPSAGWIGHIEKDYRDSFGT